MQNDEIKTWLSDIKQAIAEIKSFLPSKKYFFEFQKDVKTKRAIERNIISFPRGKSFQIKRNAISG